MILFTNFIFHFHFHIAFFIHIIPFLLSIYITPYCHLFQSCLLPPIATNFHHVYCRLLPLISITNFHHAISYCHQFQLRHIAANFITPELPYCHQFHHGGIAVLPPISSRRNCRIAANFITLGLPYYCPFHHPGFLIS